VEIVKRWQVAPAQLLGGFGLSEQGLEDPQARLSLPVMNALLERARALTGEPGLGFYLGLQKRLSMYGFLGFATMTATTVREALELSVRYSPVITTAISLRLQVEGGYAALIIEEHADLGSARDIALLNLVVGMRTLAVRMTGDAKESGMIDLALPEPGYYPRFAHLLPNARFEQPVTQLVFDAARLEQPLPSADRSALRLAREQCEQELLALGFDGSLAQRVRRALAARDGFLALEDAAAALHMSPRTLKRRLQEAGTSYSELLDKERCERALLLLRSVDRSLEEVAARLGYSTVPNFARAFRRWTGQTPAGWRRASVRR
jgi:AraC-like DNA-binding protein